jgi:hypothetical protein
MYTGLNWLRIEYTDRSCEHDNEVRFQALVTASMKMSAFWENAPCCLLEVDRRFRDTRTSALMVDAVRTSETSVYFKETTLHFSQKADMFTIMKLWFHKRRRIS